MNAQNKRSLREIFVSTFHNKMSFEDFYSLNVSEEYKVINTRKRKIYSATSKLKLLHKFINSTVLERAQFNKEVVFSYRKGASTRDSVELHAGNNYFFQTDISNFYGSIHLSDVRFSLENRLLDIPVADIDEHIERIIELVVVDDHIPAGFSTSPLLSNICLFDFDNALKDYCDKGGLVYTRYSDDLIISGKFEDFTFDVESIVFELLKSKVNSEIELNSSKTKVHKKGHDFKLLGFNILPNGIVTIPSTDKREVETLLYLYLTDKSKFDDYFSKKISTKTSESSGKPVRDSGIASLSGKLIGFNSMDKSYVSKLRRKYGNTLIDMFIRKSVK